MVVMIAARSPDNRCASPGGVETMMQNVVAGCVLLALVFMGWLAYAQKHDEFCMHGHLFKTHKPCGSVSAEM